MANTTFSGPIRSGTQREGAGSNLGLAVLARVFDSGDMTGKVIGNTDTLIGYLPANADIVDIVHDQVVAAATGTMTMSVGKTSGGAELAAAVATTAGGRFRGTATAATQLAWQTDPAADTPVYVRAAVGTGTLTAGRVITTVLYIQR